MANDSKLEPVLNLIKWGVSKYILITVLAGLLGFFVGEWVSFSSRAADRMERSLDYYGSARSEWIAESSALISRASPSREDPLLLTQVEAQGVEQKVDEIITTINNLPAPTRDIRSAGIEFRQALQDLRRELSRYQGTAEDFARVVVASQVASLSGEEHRQSIERYLGGTFTNLRGTIWQERVSAHVFERDH